MTTQIADGSRGKDPTTQLGNTEGGTLLGRLRRDMVYYIPSQVLGILLNLAGVAVFTRLLDRTAYGTYAIVVSGAQMLNEFVFGWFQASAFRYWFARTKEGEETHGRFLSTVLAILGVLLAATALVWPLLNRVLFSKTRLSVAWWGFALLVGQVAIRMVLMRTRALREMGSLFWYSIAPQILSIAIGIGLMKASGPRPEAILIGATFGYFAVVMFELSRRFRDYVPRRFIVDAAEIRRILDYGLPILVTGVGSVLLFSSDRFLIAHFVGLSAAGLYVIGYTLAFKLENISIVLLSGSFPLLVQDYETRPREEVAGSLARLIAVFCAIAVPATVGFALVFRPLASLVLGADFQEAVRFVMPLLPGVFASGLTRYLSKSFQLASKTRPMIVIQFAAAVPQLLLNLILLPRFGPVVAAYTNTLALIVVMVFTYVLSQRYLPVPLPWGEMARIALCTAVMVVVVVVASAPFSNPILLLVVRIGAGLMAYAGMVVWLNVVGIRMRAAKLWRSVFSR